MPGNSSVTISSRLTPSEFSFIARLVVQVLSYGGIFLLGFIIIGNAPLIAPAHTHDILNRIVGNITLTTSSAQWLFKRLKGKGDFPKAPPPLSLAIAILLLLLYTAFVALTDVGLIGFHLCPAPPTYHSDVAASVHSDADAFRMMKKNFLNDTIDPASVQYQRCDASRLGIHRGIIVAGCTSWINLTYSDPTPFLHLNSTDSDVLMPRRLAHLPNDYPVYTNSYIVRVNGPPLTQPVLQDAIAIEPQSTGVRSIIGVPDLSNGQSVWMPKTMAIEADMGCMSLGIVATKSEGKPDDGYFETQGSWREYAGPDIFYDVLSDSVDLTRAYYKHLYNTSAADGSLHDPAQQSSNLPFSASLDVISTPSFSSIGNSTEDFYFRNQIAANCSKALQAKLNVPVPDSRRITSPVSDADAGNMCGFLQISVAPANNETHSKMTKLLCATATYVNMVSVTVSRNPDGDISLSNLTRLPSTLNIIDTDYWFDEGNGTVVLPSSGILLGGVLRYTLSDNSSGPLIHPIFQRSPPDSDFLRVGAGSAGIAISELGPRMFRLDTLFDKELQGLLNDTALPKVSVVERVTRWGGGVGASHLLGSVGYTGWAARSSNSPQLIVQDLIRQDAICYRLVYGLAFLPLFLTFLCVLLWTLGMMLRRSMVVAGLGETKVIYGGIAPLVAATHEEEDSILGWGVQGKFDQKTRIYVVKDAVAIGEGHPQTLASTMVPQ